MNFDPDRLWNLIKETVEKREELKCNVAGAGGDCQLDDPAADFQPAADLAGLIKQGEEIRLPVDWQRDADVRSLQETTLYGIRGAAAYADPAAVQGQEDDGVYASLQEKLAKISTKIFPCRIGDEEEKGYLRECQDCGGRFITIQRVQI